MRHSVIAAIGALLGFDALAGGGAGVAEAYLFTGTCLKSPSLPCSAVQGQRYGDMTLPAGGYDSEAAMEAVLAHVLGPPVDVAPLAAGLTGDSGDFDFTPEKVAGSQRFDWSYRGGTQTAGRIANP
jgi:hypothetical protein